MTETPNTPNFRPAAHSDIASIEHLLLSSNLPVAGVADLITRDARQFTVATDNDGAVVAVGGLEVCCNHALLRSVAVRDDWRTRGLGHELIERLVCEAETRGIHALWLLTLTAEHYFPRFGFQQVARDVVPPEIAETLEFKSACPATAVAMTRALHAPLATA